MILDLASLRTLVAAVDLGGFGKAAERLHRSPAAVSLQMKVLAEQLNLELFRKVGRQQVPTEAAERLVGYARRMLQLNEEALLAIGVGERVGEVRFGMPQDFADGWLPATLGRFTALHPAIRLGVSVCGSAQVRELLATGGLDLGLTFADGAAADPCAVGRLPVDWYGAPTFRLADGDAVPLLLFDGACVFRRAAVDAIERAGRSWSIALASDSVSALWAAARAGLGVLPRAAIHKPLDVQALGSALGLPALPPVTVSLQHGPAQARPAVALLASIVKDDVAARLRT